MAFEAPSPPYKRVYDGDEGYDKAAMPPYKTVRGRNRPEDLAEVLRKRIGNSKKNDEINAGTYGNVYLKDFNGIPDVEDRKEVLKKNIYNINTIKVGQTTTYDVNHVVADKIFQKQYYTSYKIIDNVEKAWDIKDAYMVSKKDKAGFILFWL